MHKHYDTFVRFTGIMLFARGIIFFASAIMIGFSHSVAVPSTINEVITPLVLLFFYLVYTMILAMRLYGVFLGSHNVLFREKLNSFNHSNYKNGSEYAERREVVENGQTTKDIDIDKIQALNAKRPSMPVSRSMKPLTMAILLIIDLGLAIVFELSIGDLPRFYTVMAVEGIMIMLALREKMYE
jgi:hypothetical protein